MSTNDEIGIRELQKRTAVILTCFNRREKTLRCLERLRKIAPSISIYLVDDGSTDSTGEAVQTSFPKVSLIHGNGALYWNRGMHLAWEHASRRCYDYYVWLNDDVVLRESCFEELYACSRAMRDQAVISGIIDSHDHTEILYGGTGPDKTLLEPNGQMQEISNLNGNVVLVPRSVFEILGNLDPYYWHDLGDVDYGYRARSAGIPVVTTRAVVASCDRNLLCRVRADGSTFYRRMVRLYSPLGNHPRINFHFRKRHFGLLNAMGYYVFLNLINIAPDWLVHYLFENRYRSVNEAEGRGGCA